MYSSTPYFNETFKKVNINMSMDTGPNKEGDSFHNAIFSFWKYMPLPESGLSQFIHAIIKILGNHLLLCVCDRT